MKQDKVKFCLFDMDGLLLDTENAVWLKAQEVVLTKHGYTVTPELIAAITGLGFVKYAIYMKEHIDPNFDEKTIIKELYDYFEDVVINGVIPKKKGAVELLTYCKNNGIKMAVGTSTHRKYSQRALENAGIYNYFDYMLAADEVDNPKPNPEIYLKSVEYLNIPKENCLIFEDSYNGCLTAFNAGIRLIVVPDISYVPDDVKQKAFRVIDDLSQAIAIIEECNK